MCVTLRGRVGSGRMVPGGHLKPRRYTLKQKCLVMVADYVVDFYIN